MKTRGGIALLGLGLVMALISGCGQSDARMLVDISPNSIDANGRSTARVTVTLEGFEGVVLLSTSRGTFQDSGAERTTIQATAGQAVGVLVACDESLAPECPGSASVVATAGEEIGFGIVTFLGSATDGG